MKKWPSLPSCHDCAPHCGGMVSTSRPRTWRSNQGGGGARESTRFGEARANDATTLRLDGWTMTTEHQGVGIVDD